MERENWWELFAAGTHTDRKGRRKTFSTDDLDYMVEKYNPDNHEAPICVDHDETASPFPGGPAYGWVKRLKREGGKLLGVFHQVAPAFAQAVNDGRFKKRSIGTFADGSLRHVAFLGAKIPAVPGLRDNMFSDDSTLVGEWDFSMADEPNIIHEEESMELKELQAQLEAETRSRLAAEIKVAGLQSENDRLSREFSAAERSRVREDIDRFIADGIKSGVILPAWKNDGLPEFMAGLADGDREFQFSEGVKKDPLDWFKGFISGFAKHSLFKAMTPPVEPAKTGSEFSADEQQAVTLIVNAGKPA